jgi:hypothetical protein
MESVPETSSTHRLVLQSIMVVRSNRYWNTLYLTNPLINSQTWETDHGLWNCVFDKTSRPLLRIFPRSTKYCLLARHRTELKMHVIHAHFNFPTRDACTTIERLRFQCILCVTVSMISLKCQLPRVYVVCLLLRTPPDMQFRNDLLTFDPGNIVVIWWWLYGTGIKRAGW